MPLPLPPLRQQSDPEGEHLQAHRWEGKGPHRVQPLLSHCLLGKEGQDPLTVLPACLLGDRGRVCPSRGTLYAYVSSSGKQE